jgi:hypothetical protein
VEHETYQPMPSPGPDRGVRPTPGWLRAPYWRQTGIIVLAWIVSLVVTDVWGLAWWWGVLAALVIGAPLLVLQWMAERGHSRSNDRGK